MDTRFLESFVTVVDHGSIAAAARRLGLTPAAVAQRIRTLEGDIGYLLLERSGQVARPTPAGRAIVAKARAVLVDVRALRGAAAGGEAVGEIRIGAISTALTGLLPAILKRLAAAAPRLTVYIRPGTSADLYKALVDGEVDAAFLVEPRFVLPKSFAWLPVRTEPLIVIAPAAFEAADPLDLLRTEPFLRYDRHHWGGRLADDHLKALEIVPRERMELDSLEAIAVMVATGLGVSLVPDWAPPWPVDREIVRLSAGPAAPHRRVGLLRIRLAPQSHLVDVLEAATRPTAQGRVDRS